MASQSGESGFVNSLMKRFLAIEDTGKAAELYLRRAIDWEPDNYLAHMLLGWMEERAGNFAAARGNLSQAIARRPDLVLAYNLRSHVFHVQAMQTPAGTERNRLLRLALEDANAADSLASQYEIIGWLRGNALRGLGQHSQAATAYLEALNRELPVDMLQLQQWHFILQGRDPNLARRMGYLLPNRFEDARLYAKSLLEDQPDNPQFHLLQSKASLELQDWDTTKSAANRVLDIASQTQVVAPILRSQAHAVLGEVYRHQEDWTKSRDAFSQALQLIPENATAASGLARVMEQLATQSKDALQTDLAYAAYENLAAVAEADWQPLQAYRGMYRVRLMQHNEAAASDVLDRLLLLDQGQDIAQLSQQARSAGANAILQKLAELRIPTQIEKSSRDRQSLRFLPLRNGHFELGLNAYWKPWSTQGAAVAEAGLDSTVRQVGAEGRSLWIQHHSPPAASSRAILEQTMPAEAGSSYQISLRAKGQEVSADAVQIVIDENWDHPAVRFPEGTYDWQPLSGEFAIPKSEPTNNGARLVSIKIVSTAPGKVWMDDIRIQKIAK